MNKILICDDEDDIRYALKIYLKSDEYELIEAHDGKEATDMVRTGAIDLVLLDIMMPGVDGIEAMKEIRSFSNIPIILLTAKSESTDKVSGLEAGADDYITKPFDPADVRARVKAQLRRYTALGSRMASIHVIRIGGIEMDDSTKKAYVNGEEADLTFAEYEILKLLMNNPGMCFSPAEIYRTIWNEDAGGSERSIAVHIRHLREKIEVDPANPRYLQAVWGQGYRIVGQERG